MFLMSPGARGLGFFLFLSVKNYIGDDGLVQIIQTGFMSNCV